MTLPGKRAEVLAVVVAFRPDELALASLVARLASQVGRVLVVDNSDRSDRRAERSIEEWIDRSDEVALVRAGANLGIAAALNIGIDAAFAGGFSHVLLSDQDSCPELDMVERLLEVSDELRSVGVRVGCVSATYVDEVTSQSMPFQVKEAGWLFYRSFPGERAVPWVEVMTSITSGTLVPLAAIEVAGPMLEELFIDDVDAEWCHRARSRGLRLFGTGRARLRHRLGDGEFRVWYLRWRKFNAYSPLRLYYRFRNFVLLCRMAHVPLNWKVRAGWYWLGNAYAYSVYSSNRRENIRHILQGVLDGMCGRTGPFPGK